VLVPMEHLYEMARGCPIEWSRDPGGQGRDPDMFIGLKISQTAQDSHSRLVSMEHLQETT